MTHTIRWTKNGIYMTDILVDGFNSFYNVEARGLGGAGKKC